MTDGYQIVRYRPELKPEVLELQRFLWSQDLDVNAAYFEWKYERAPYLTVPLIHLALHGGRVVGMRGLHGSKWEVGRPSEIFFAHCTDDLVVHPEHRNRGLAARIIRAASEDPGDEDQRWVFSPSAGPVTVVSSLALGWRRIAAMRQVERGPSLRWRLADQLVPVVGRSNLLKRAARRAWRALTPVAGNPFTQLERSAVRHPGESGGAVSVWAQPQPEAMADLIARLAWDGRIRHVRDREYLDWRFRNPLYRYCFLFWRDTRLEGYLVLRAPVAWMGPVAIADWEGSSRRVLGDLLCAAIAWGGFGKLIAWTSAVSDERALLLRDSGFREQVRRGAARYTPCVLVRPVPDWTISGRSLLDPANWDMRMLYSMLG